MTAIACSTAVLWVLYQAPSPGLSSDRGDLMQQQQLLSSDREDLMQQQQLRRQSYIKPSLPPGCVDNTSFIDEFEYVCVDWIDFPCTEHCEPAFGPRTDFEVN